MLTRIMKSEWRNLTADRSPVAIAIILGAAIAYGAYNGSRWVRFQKETIASALAEERQRLNGIKIEIPKIESGEKKVSSFADSRLPQSLGRNMGLRYAAMQPGPLGSLAIGQSDLYPYYFKVSTGSKQSFVNNDELENPVHLLAGRFDLSFALLYLFPLVILAFSYNLISAEKEGGTLAMALSQPVSLQHLVTAKVTLRALFAVALALALSIAGVMIGGAELSAPGAASRLLLWIVVTVLYGAFWFALAVAVNAFGRGSAHNAMVLAGLWLFFVVVMPSALNVAVKSAHPVPSRVELIQAARVAGEDATRKSSHLLARYLEDHPDLAPKTKGDAPDYGTLLVAVNEEAERSVQPVLNRFDAQVTSQQGMVDRFRYLSPAIVAQSAFNDLAGSGLARYTHFMTQVDDYHRRWRGFFTPRILRREKLSSADIDKLPAFSYREEPMPALIERVTLAIAGLIIPALLVAFFARARLRRYPLTA